MKQYGMTAQEAMDYIVKGTQNGLDKTNELGDNLSEYSGKFAQAGYSASEYFQLLQNGLQGGAYNLDKVNDAINEVTTRLADGTIGDSIDLYSQKTQGLFLAWQNGEATQKQVIDSIVADIANCTSEQQALNMAAEAFGTMAEDGNLKFITSLTSVGETYDSVAGSAQNLFDQTGTPMQEMEANTRKLQQALVPLGEKIVELANVVLPPLVAIITAVSEVFGMLPEPVQNFVVILGALLVAFTALVPIIAALAVSFGALNISLLPIIGIIAAVAAAIAVIIAVVKNWGAITQWFGQLWETVVVRAAVGNRICQADGALGQGGGLLYGDNPGSGSEIRGFLLCHPPVVEQSLVADCRIFRQYLEQYQKYSHAGLERYQADGSQCGERAEAGSSEYLLGAVPVYFPDLEHAEADRLQYLERHQDHGSEYRLRAEGRCGERL